MEGYSQLIQLRWSDMDPNFHIRHSVYYDWGALCRIGYLGQFGLDSNMMAELKVGPILFREECVFKREIILQDPVSINLKLGACRPDYSRWTIVHTIMKDPETVAAILTCEGAWLNTEARKLAVPLVEVVRAFEAMERVS